MARAAPTDERPRTVAEFEAWHARQPERWEFIDAQPRLMAPGSMRHSIIKNNVGAALRQALQDHGCTVLIDGPQILTEEISAIPGVSEVDVNLETGTVVVTSDTELDPQAVADAVDEAGYALVA